MSQAPSLGAWHEAGSAEPRELQGHSQGGFSLGKKENDRTREGDQGNGGGGDG